MYFIKFTDSNIGKAVNTLANNVNNAKSLKLISLKLKILPVAKKKSEIKNQPPKIS